MNHEGFAEGDDTLLGPGDRAFQQKEVVLNDTVMRETAQWCNGLLRNVVLGGGIIFRFTEADTIDLLVDFRSVVITICESKPLRVNPIRVDLDLL